MASEKDLELLDDYLTNRLSGTDREVFEERLRQDPDLQSELSFQQQIADGLRKARAAELKDMLKKIPVGTAGQATNSLLKWAGAGTALVVVIGAYLYMKEPQPVPVTEPATTERAPSAAEVQVPSVDAVIEEPTTTESVPAETKTPATTKKHKPQTTTGTDPKKVEVFDPSEELTSTENTGAPERTESAVQSEPVLISRDVRVIKDNRKYKFHYQLDGNDLTLYGDFEKNLYTIMEFKSEDKQTVIFMFYKNGYYLLNQSANQVNQLIPVNDPVLLKRLREQRAME